MITNVDLLYMLYLFMLASVLSLEAMRKRPRKAHFRDGCCESVGGKGEGEGVSPSWFPVENHRNDC